MSRGGMREANHFFLGRRGCRGTIGSICAKLDFRTELLFHTGLGHHVPPSMLVITAQTGTNRSFSSGGE